MSSKRWREELLEQVAEEITVGYVGPMAAEYVPKGIPFLRSQNVEQLVINKKDLKFISTEFHERIKKSALRPGDVVIVRTGKPGACAVIPDWLRVSNCSDLVIVRCGPNLDPRFLAYYINTSASDHVLAHLVGAVQQHFNVGSARKIKMLLPDIEVQRSIVHILGSLDDKIELNRRMNATLEEMARAVYGELVKVEGGKEKTIGEVVTVVGGSTPSTTNPEFWEGGSIYWATPKDLASLQSPILLDTNSQITEKGLQEISSGLLPIGTVLLSSRAPIGYLAISQIPVAINQGFIAIKCTEEIPNYFILNWLKARLCPN